MSGPAAGTTPTVGPRSKGRWLNRTVLGIGLASLFSDWSHEIATAVMPAFLATLGVAAAWLGLIEWIFTRFEKRPFQALVLSAASTALLWLITYDIAVLQMGRYVVLWPPSAMAMLGRYLLLKVEAKKASLTQPACQPVTG